MPTYIYTRSTGKPHISGGRTVTYQIYKLVKSRPKYMGEHKANTAAYRGDTGEVNEFIAKKDHYKCDGYRIKRKDVHVYEV